METATSEDLGATILSLLNFTSTGTGVPIAGLLDSLDDSSPEVLRPNKLNSNQIVDL